MDFGEYSSILTAGVTAAALYFSPYNTSTLMAFAHGFGVTYAVKSLTSGDANHLKCAVVSGAGAAAGFYGAPFVSMDPALLSAIAAPGAYLILDKSSLY